jgi:hypothetical protein
VDPHRGSPLRGNPRRIAADPFGMVCHVPNFENQLGISSEGVAMRWACDNTK